MTDLSDDAKQLALRYLVGELTEVQFNFLCHQKQFDKEAILAYLENLRKTGRIVSTSLLLLVFLIFCLFYYFLFGGFR